MVPLGEPGRVDDGKYLIRGHVSTGQVCVRLQVYRTGPTAWK